jgi:hypothetical protein
MKKRQFIRRTADGKNTIYLHSWIYRLHMAHNKTIKPRIEGERLCNKTNNLIRNWIQS